MTLRKFGTILVRLFFSALLLLGNTAFVLKRAADAGAEKTVEIGPLAFALDPLLMICLAIMLIVVPLWLGGQAPKLKARLSGYTGMLLWSNGLALLALLLLQAFGPPPLAPAQSEATPSPAQQKEVSRRPIRPVGRSSWARPETPAPQVEPSPAADATPVPAVTRAPQVKPAAKAKPAPKPTADPYAKIDAHALAAPPEVERSIEKLAAYLVKPARNDREKMRAIFRWVSDRVAYDTEAFFSGNIPDQSAEQTLSTRLSVCAGYAYLTDALGKAAGLETEVVEGFGRGIDPDSEKPDSNHAWNAVKLEGQWYLMDATWAAGSTGDDQKFHKKYNDFWFLTEPQAFLNSHRPDEDRWQLVESALGWEDFQEQPLLGPEFFQSGIKLSAGVSRGIEASPVGVIALDVPTSIQLSGVLKDNSGREIENAVSIFRQGTAATVSVKAPAAGDYEFHLFSGPYGADMLDGIVRLKVTASRGDETGYPALTSEMQQREGKVTEPRQGVLSPGRQKFDLRIPGAKTVFVGDWDHELRRDGDRFTGELDLPSGEALVFAQFENERGAVGVVTYQVRP